MKGLFWHRARLFIAEKSMFYWETSHQTPKPGQSDLTGGAALPSG